MESFLKKAQSALQHEGDSTLTILDAWRHGQTDANAMGRPFTHEENPLLHLTEHGRGTSRELGRLCERTYGPGYFDQALVACPPTTRAFETLLQMHFGARQHSQAAGLSAPEPLILAGLKEPAHGSTDWTTAQMPWDHEFPTTGDSLAKCYGRVTEALHALVRVATERGTPRIIVITSGHVCRLLALAATGVGKSGWDTFANPNNCRGYRIGPEGNIANPFLRGNDVAVEEIGF